MTRCYLPPSSWPCGEFQLPPEAAQHLGGVLRMKPGGTFELFDGEGRTAGAVITRVDGKRIHAEAAVPVHAPPLLPRIELVMAHLREQKMDLVLQKAVELGASAVHVFEPDHAVARWKEDKADRKMDRWRQVMISACEQSGAAWLPVLSPPRPLEQALAGLGGVGIFGDLEAGGSLREVLQRGDSTAAVFLAVGPEGDFSAREKTLLRESDWKGVNLGPLILRAETAALYMLSAAGVLLR